MPDPRSSRGIPGPLWEKGVRLKFHYTQPDFAELILSEQTYRVSRQAGKAGHGLYVTSAQPGSMPEDALLSMLFARERPKMFIDGVVVLRNDAFTWERYEPRKYVHRTGPGAILDLSLVLVGIGARRRGNWLFSEGIYAA